MDFLFWFLSVLAIFIWRECAVTGKANNLEVVWYISFPSARLSYVIGRFRERYWYSRKAFYNYLTYNCITLITVLFDLALFCSAFIIILTILIETHV